jgi:hypothetical protein
MVYGWEIYSGSDFLEDLGVENLHFRSFCRMSPSVESVVHSTHEPVARAARIACLVTCHIVLITREHSESHEQEHEHEHE